MRRRSTAFCAVISVTILAGMPAAFAAPPGAGASHPSTLTEALSEAYANNPTLQQQRANLRATDEDVPAALAGWRPTVEIQGSAGRITGTTEQSVTGTNYFGQTVLQRSILPQSRNEAIGQLTVTQPIFKGGATVAKTHQAKDSVYAARAQLLATEQDVFTKVVQAYVTVITNRQLLALNINNRKVLAQQLQAVQDQFNVGEITETSVAQAQAALAGARAQVEIARGNLKIAEATFQQLVGAWPAHHLAPPQPLVLPVRTKAAIVRQAMINNPNVIAALFTQSASKDAVDVAIAALAPQVSVSASAFDESNPSGPHGRSSGGQVLANLTVPLYQGGSEYAAIRQARDKVQYAIAGVIDARRTAVQQATQAWEGLIASKAAVVSTTAQIHSDAIALDGTERQEIVGTRTTLDVLNAQELLLNAQTTQIQNIANVVEESYAIAAAIGRLTATDLDLPVTHYDDLKYYDSVKDSLFGNGNKAYQEAGIAPDGSLLAEPQPQLAVPASAR
ncbi:MAG TPA: TolC family outer membrane protein [Acidiphilium sp.]